MKREEDSLMTPALEELQERIPQKYELVLVATRRAKQLIRQQRMAELGAPVPEHPGIKPLSVALRDIAEGQINVEDILAPEFDVDDYQEDSAQLYTEMPEMGDDFSQAFDVFESQPEEKAAEPSEDNGGADSSVEPDDPQFNWSGD